MPPSRASLRLVTALAVLATTGAAAVVHAALLRTEPSIGATVASAPAAVRLWFSEPVEATTDPLIVLDPRGRRIDQGAGVSPDDVTRLEARVPDAGPGSYTVRWRAVSEDGHVVSEAYLYHVQYATRTEPAGGPTAPSSGSITVARAIHLSGMTVAIGALALVLLIGAPSTAATRTLATLGSAGAAVVIVGAGIDAWAQTVALGGKPAAGAVFSGAVWGALWAARAVAGAGLIALFALARASGSLAGARRNGAVALVAVLLIATAADGHARVTSPVWLSIPIQLVHLAATGAWIGGALALYLLARSARAAHNPNGSVVLDVITLVPRFSQLALTCVTALILTGLYQSWTHIARFAMLGTTFYGRALLVKLAFLALLAIPASFNRWVLKPQLTAAMAPSATDRDSVVDRFVRLLGIEIVLGALVLIAGAMLATTAPPVDVPQTPVAATATASTSVAPSF